jgi:hypothetical protein
MKPADFCGISTKRHGRDSSISADRQVPHSPAQEFSPTTVGQSCLLRQALARVCFMQTQSSPHRTAYIGQPKAWVVDQRSALDPQAQGTSIRRALTAFSGGRQLLAVAQAIGSRLPAGSLAPSACPTHVTASSQGLFDPVRGVSLQVPRIAQRAVTGSQSA